MDSGTWGHREIIVCDQKLNQMLMCVWKCVYPRPRSYAPVVNDLIEECFEAKFNSDEQTDKLRMKNNINELQKLFKWRLQLTRSWYRPPVLNRLGQGVVCAMASPYLIQRG